MNFNSQISVLPVGDKRKLLKDIINENQEVLDTYGDYPLDEDDVTDMVRDVNLSDRQVLKILSIIRKKWGNNKVTPNIRNLLKERKRVLSHLYTVEYLDKEHLDHFVDKSNQAVSRYLV